MKLRQSLSGKWEEERLLLFSVIEELQDGLEEQKASAKKSLDAAHTKIRQMDSWKTKAWAATGAATFLGIVVVELLRLLFARH
jgi:hypothetical protein